MEYKESRDGKKKPVMSAESELGRRKRGEHRDSDDDLFPEENLFADADPDELEREDAMEADAEALAAMKEEEAAAVVPSVSPEPAHLNQPYTAVGCAVLDANGVRMAIAGYDTNRELNGPQLASRIAEGLNRLR